MKIETDTQYIGKAELASLFACPWRVAAETLGKAGVCPIDLGPGRGRGKRWLLSAVLEAMRTLHEKAQPKKREAPRPEPKTPYLNVAAMSVAEIRKLVQEKPFANPARIQ